MISNSFSEKKNTNHENSEESDNKTRSTNSIEHTIYKYSNNNGGNLLEAVLVNNTGFFLEIKDKEILLHERLIQNEKTILMPPKDKISYLSKEYSFSSIEEIRDYVRRAMKENPSSLFRRLRKIWRKFFDIDEESLTLCAADTLFTYFQDKLGMTHYLLFVGDNSTGKSNALRIFYHLGYRPILDTDITPANIYNFLDRVEEGQGIILEDEIDNIEEQPEKMKIYKGGYVSGTRVTRLYESAEGSKTKRKQQRFFTFCFKAFSSEKNPSFFKAKGFNERLLVINCSSGNPQYDISEIENNAGDPVFRKLEREIEDTRKLLFIYRLCSYDTSIPDIHLSIKNRDKQLCKPLLRLFQNNDVTDKIIKSLSKFIIEKKNKKLNSLDSLLYAILLDSAQRNDKYGKIFTISNDTLWSVIQTLPGSIVASKPNSYQTDEFGMVSKIQLTKICEDKFGAERGHDGKQRCLKFKKNVIERLKDNYSKIDKIEITYKTAVKGDGDANAFNAFNTFWNSLSENKFKDRNLESTKLNNNPLLKTINNDVRPKVSEKIDMSTKESDIKESTDSEKTLQSLKALARDDIKRTKDERKESDFMIYLNSQKEELKYEANENNKNSTSNANIGFKYPFYYCKQHPSVENIHSEEIKRHLELSKDHQSRPSNPD
ncbi:hypothetical protein [Candidatus Nitrosocosmicus sp. FF01]|uniref:hypothetical protein n=1 Tax=Candidatus Nitrosocosmicus sp. FF01 TaxID=3397670 RepID=UPI0039EB655A